MANRPGSQDNPKSVNMDSVAGSRIGLNLTMHIGMGIQVLALAMRQSRIPG